MSENRGWFPWGGEGPGAESEGVEKWTDASKRVLPPPPRPGHSGVLKKGDEPIRLAGNESWDPIHTDAIIFSLPYLGVNGAECFLSGSDNPHTPLRLGPSGAPSK